MRAIDEIRRVGWSEAIFHQHAKERRASKRPRIHEYVFNFEEQRRDHEASYKETARLRYALAAV